MSSRIIVKNLPKIVTKERLQEHFSKLGQVTDVRLVHSPSGTFRRFAFIGYLDESQASKAVEYFNKSFIDSCKIEVEVAKPFGSSDVPRNSWSRSHGRADQVGMKEGKAESVEGEALEPSDGLQRLNQEHHKSKLAEYLGEMYELADDPEFAEFLSLHKSTSVNKVWANDDTDAVTASLLKKKQKRQLVEDCPAEEDEEGEPKLKKRKKDKQRDSSNNGGKGIDSKSDTQIQTTKKTKKEDGRNTKNEESVNKVTPTRTPYTLKMRGVPFKSKPKAVRDFFYPLKLSDIRMDMLEAFKRNRDCIGRRYIELFKEEPSMVETKSANNKPRPWENKMVDEEGVESIAESGRLFIRNLSYSITEDDLTQLFEKYGPLTEVLLPLDKTTSKPIGLGFVTFMLPEHAVKAFNELDKQIFQGRLLHIMPSKPPIGPSTKPVVQNDNTSSYKKTKEISMKESSTSAHNWNSLFLGSNAVVDAMADRYDVDKSDLLDVEGDQPLAVRLALGETQLVTETREFLEEQGVVLDAFDNAKLKRSKKIILMKNLAFGTTSSDLMDLFEPWGLPSRIILPPGGISALVEFSEASTAQKVFKKLAYSEFKDVPLYLEWAPIGVLKNPETDEAVHETVADTTDAEPKSSKLLVRNVPFEAGKKEVMQLFGTIGKLKNVRLPKKMGSTNEHRGFCFVEYVTKEDAKRAFDNLGRSTHLYGRRLVLEWAEVEENVSDIRQKTSRYFNSDNSENIAKRRKTLKKKLMDTLEASEES